MTRHLDTSWSRHFGVIRRLRHESGLLLAILFVLSSLNFLGDLTLSAYGLALFAVAAVPSALLLAYGLWLDRHEPEPAWLLLRCLLWGGTVAVFIASTLNALVSEFVDYSSLVTIYVPLIEEGAKAATLVWLVKNHLSHINGRLDILLYALFVGLGFTVVEDLSYYLASHHDEDAELLVTMIARVPTTLLHPLFTAFTGLGLLLGAHSRGVGRTVFPIFGLAIAAALHGLWNSDVSFEARLWVFLPLLFAFVLVCHAEHRREAAIVKVGLSECDPAGDPTEIEYLTTVVQGRKPGLFQWLAAARDPGHASHLEWRLRQLVWLSASLDAATSLARSQRRPKELAPVIRREAAALLKENLAAWNLLQNRLGNDPVQAHLGG